MFTFEIYFIKKIVSLTIIINIYDVFIGILIVRLAGHRKNCENTSVFELLIRQNNAT